MAEMVEIQDDDGSDIVQDVTDAVTVPAFEELRTLKREMEFRGSLLGKTWSELSRIMTKYQSQLIDKHEQYESNISAGEQGRLTQLESVIAKKSSDVHRLEKSVSDLERKLLEKDGEIVRLRTEVHKLRNEVSMKDSLIHKLQNQMAKEAMEYSAEINSLKEILEMENEHNTGAIGPSSMKKRRLPAASITRQTHDLAPNSDIPPFSTKNEIILESCAMNKSSTIGISAASQRVYNQSAASVNQSAFPTDIHNDGSNLDAEHDQSHESADNSFQDNQFIKLDEQEEDHQDMEDPMADLLHENNQNAAPQVLVQNVHSLTNQQQMSIGNVFDDEAYEPLMANYSIAKLKEMELANEQYGNVLGSPTRKPRKNHDYDKPTRERIAKLAMELGDRATARHFTNELGFPVHYWTVYNFKKQYLRKLARQEQGNSTASSSKMTRGTGASRSKSTSRVQADESASHPLNLVKTEPIYDDQ